MTSYTGKIKGRDEDLLSRRHSKGRFNRAQALLVKRELRRLSVR